MNPVELVEHWSRRGWTPPPRISVPAWADRFRRLAREAGSSSGRWRTSTVEAARGPMLAVTEPGVRTVTLMSATQLLKTSVMENVVGWMAHLDPRPMLLLQPKEDACEQFSRERIMPMIRVTPALRELMGSSGTRAAKQTLLYYGFPGGFLALASAGSPDNLARRPIGALFCDECDNYPALVNGDPIALAEERLASFGNWLSIRACSPTIEGESRIEASYASSDQRKASVVCPHCDHRQFLEFFGHVQWGKNEAGEHQPDTARIYCQACGAAWSEGQRLRALATIRWHQTRPFTCCGHRHAPLDAYALAWQGGAADPIGAVWDWWESSRHAVYRARCPDCGAWPLDNAHAGFHASKLLSPWTRDTPAKIAAKWLDAQGNEAKLLTFYNTQMAMPHTPNTGSAVKGEGIAARGENWAAEVPDGVALITVGADFQTDRGEFETVGWGRDEESWSLDYTIIEGNPEHPEFWARVDQHLLRKWQRADGTKLEVKAACLDSGFLSEHVYQFARARLGRRVWATKGQSAKNGQRSPVWPTTKPSARRKQGFRPVILGVNSAKDVIRARLAIEKPGPGYMHFPADRDLAYYSQLTSERLVTKQVGATRFRIWELPRGRANEALDCRVYAYAALSGLLHFGMHLNRMVTTMEKQREEEPEPQQAPRRDGGASDARPGPRDPVQLPPSSVPVVITNHEAKPLTRAQRMAR